MAAFLLGRVPGPVAAAIVAVSVSISISDPSPVSIRVPIPMSIPISVVRHGDLQLLQQSSMWLLLWLLLAVLTVLRDRDRNGSCVLVRRWAAVVHVPWPLRGWHLPFRLSAVTSEGLRSCSQLESLELYASEDCGESALDRWRWESASAASISQWTTDYLLGISRRAELLTRQAKVDRSTPDRGSQFRRRPPVEIGICLAVKLCTPGIHHLPHLSTKASSFHPSLSTQASLVQMPGPDFQIPGNTATELQNSDCTWF